MARTKGALNKRTKEIREVAMELTPKATARLKLLLDSDNENVALGAVREVYDRAFGKATQHMQGNFQAVMNILSNVPRHGDN